MFTQTARFYDAIYSFKDYARECEMICELAADKVGGTLLDIACGTGKHLVCLRDKFQCEGLDLDPALLDIGRQRLPGTPFHQGDMVDFDLGEQFDVVTCLFSSIGYVETVERLQKALVCMARHTKPGGMAIVEPWLGPEVWNTDHLHALFVDEPDLKLARMSTPGREGNVSTVRFEYLISTREGIERAAEDHRLGLFTHDEHMQAFTKAGFDARFIEGGLMGRGLYVATRG